jgi:hypothetical protein
VNNDRETKPGVAEGGVRGFFATLLQSLVRDIVKFITAFALGTGAGAIVCWYYGIPLAFSLIGGFIVLGFALAVMSDSLFS